jgi:hypothetical protein
VASAGRGVGQTRRHASAALRRAAIPCWARGSSSWRPSSPLPASTRPARPGRRRLAARATPEGEPVGLVSDRAMVSSLVTATQVVPLRSPEHPRFPDGGPHLVMKSANSA